jgi:hypothetical protein
MHCNRSYLKTLAIGIASTTLMVAGAQAATTEAAGSIDARERADCEAGRSTQDRATCLKEAGAAARERKRNGLANVGSARLNATERCKPLPVEDKADCLARIEGPASPNQQVTTSGSVAAGGVIRETKTTTVGPTAASPAASSASTSAPR